MHTFCTFACKKHWKWISCNKSLQRSRLGQNFAERQMGAQFWSGTKNNKMFQRNSSFWFAISNIFGNWIYFILLKSIKTRWNSIFYMLQCFREQKKAIVSMEFERQQKECRINSAAKKQRLLGDDSIPSSLVKISAADFDILKRICPILKIFDVETLKVFFRRCLKFNRYFSILVFSRKVKRIYSNSDSKETGSLFVFLRRLTREFGAVCSTFVRWNWDQTQEIDRQ